MLCSFNLHNVDNMLPRAMVGSSSPQHATFGPSFLVVSSSSSFEEMDKAMDALLLDMINFVTPSVVTSRDEGIVEREAINVADRDINVVKPLSAFPVPIQPHVKLDEMVPLDQLFDSVISSLFNMKEPVTNIVGDKERQVEMGVMKGDVTFEDAPLYSAKEDAVAQLGQVETELGIANANSNEEITKTPPDLSSKFYAPLVLSFAEDSQRKNMEQSLTRVSEALLSRKDVQVDPIKARFARRLGEWDGMLNKPEKLHGRKLIELSQQVSSVPFGPRSASVEFPPLSLPGNNPDAMEQCLWEHFRYHLLSSQCTAALDATRSTFEALKLYQIETAQNDHLYSQLYPFLVLALAMTMASALLASLSIGKHELMRSGSDNMNHEILSAVYSDPLIKSKVEGVIGQELGVMLEMPRNRGCMGRFCILLPTLALGFLLIVTAVINPVLVLFVGVPTLCLMGLYGCMRHFFGLGRLSARANMYADNAAIPIPTASAIYVAIPIV